MKVDFKKHIDAEESWVADRIILVSNTGSKAYGTFVEGQSDTDCRAVCIPPAEYFYGLEKFNFYDNVGGKNFKSTVGTTDVVVQHICKFVKEAMLGYTENIEMLFVRDEDIIEKNTFGEELLQHRQDFITMATVMKFSGYAHSEAQRMKEYIAPQNGSKFLNFIEDIYFMRKFFMRLGKKPGVEARWRYKLKKGKARKNLIEKYGYDTKNFACSVRLMNEAFEMLKEGTFTTFRPEREELLAMRNGKYNFTEALKIISDTDRKLTELIENSKILPIMPDKDKINKWLIDLNRRALEEVWS